MATVPSLLLKNFLIFLPSGCGSALAGAGLASTGLAGSLAGAGLASSFGSGFGFFNCGQISSAACSKLTGLAFFCLSVS